MPRTNPRDRGNPSPITAARLAAGMTQAQLAKAVGRSEHSIIRWEYGLTHPTTSTLIKLAKILSCNPQDLL